MKAFFSVLVSCLIITSLPHNSFATHAAGADLTYEWISGNDYLITCTFYRDCAGIDAPTFLPIDITSQSCAYANTYTLFLVFDTYGYSILDYCPGQTNKCSGGNLTGYELYIYSGIITLPFACADWRIATHEAACI